MSAIELILDVFSDWLLVICDWLLVICDLPAGRQVGYSTLNPSFLQILLISGQLFTRLSVKALNSRLTG